MKTKTLLLTMSVCLIFSYSLSFAEGHVYIKSAPSGASVSTTSTDWEDIPDMSMHFFQYDPNHICIGFSAECWTGASKRMFVRALIDGEPAEPSDVVFATNDFVMSHSFLFAGIAEGGLHHVKMQYLVDGGGTANMGDRTMWVTTAPNIINTVAAPSGPDVTTTSSSFVDIPDLSYPINVPAPGDVAITISGEAETSSNKRMFVRVLIDGQPISPSDVVFSVGSYNGTRSFTFVAYDVTAGSHNIQTKWLVDSGGTAYMGDRTFSIAFIEPPAVNEGAGGVKSLSAPSGPDVTTTASYFSDIQDLSTNMVVPENGNLVVSLSAEINSSSSKRLFVRALVDGLPAEPSDMVISNQGFTGTSRFSFVAKHLHGGDHAIKLQWMVDGGGTGYVGDRNMTLIASAAPCPDMTDPFNGVKPLWGERPLLVICWDPHRPEHPAPPFNDVRDLIFGSNYPNVRDYYIVNSNNRFHLQDAGMKGWYDADKPWDHYWAASDPVDADGDGWISGHMEKWAEAIRKADATFNYAQYDADGDGNLTKDELGILIVIPQNSPFGTNRIAYGQEFPNKQPLVVDGVTITWIAEAYIGSPINLGVVAHELNHLFLNLPDMYFNFFQPYAAGMYSIMDVGYYDNHIDPFHKIRLGWIQPAQVLRSGVVPIEAIEQSHVAYILHDPGYGNQEYFIVENRQSNVPNGYDSYIQDDGLAVWHIMEDPDVYENLPAPDKVSPTDWATIGATDWGRRAIRMIRPIYGPPFDNSTALWDGVEPATGYNLLSDDPNADHATLTWHDGSPSGFAIKNISMAANIMEALLEVPWEPIATSINRMPLLSDRRANDYWVQHNYPNPFNPETTIPFKLDKPSHVSVKIYNVIGQEIVTLVDEQLQPGRHTVTWKSLDKNGIPVVSGVYFFRVETPSKNEIRKMILMR
ncbi:M6 family metalloprotease domain-containing protein [candidate division KSB1 bacterium]|nr:M6 family metalloprotease domain-containing protein [candidate division KSB1 bacterium]